MPFKKIMRRAAESLYEDERLRSNLTDREATVVLGWAARWIEEQVGLAKDEMSASQVAQRTLARVRPVIVAINTLAARSEVRLSEAVAALEPVLNIGQPVPRAQVFELLTVLATTMWHVPLEQVDVHQPHAALGDSLRNK
jgi:hypothetical protein